MTTIYIYSDESGVFDHIHYSNFVFGGLIFLNKEDKDNAIRNYKHIEKDLRQATKSSYSLELKAYHLSKKHKNSIYRSLNNYYKFGIIINQNRINNNIYDYKLNKQRYLDYAYKIGVKKALMNLIDKGLIEPNDEIELHFFVDEHAVATSGKYELREGLYQELVKGTFNFNYQHYYEPIFKNCNILTLKYCDSKYLPLIRAADIISNKLYYQINNNKEINENEHLTITYLP